MSLNTALKIVTKTVHETKKGRQTFEKGTQGMCGGNRVSGTRGKKKKKPFHLLPFHPFCVLGSREYLLICVNLWQCELLLRLHAVLFAWITHLCAHTPTHAVWVRADLPKGETNHLICKCGDEKQANYHGVIVNERCVYNVRVGLMVEAACVCICVMVTQLNLYLLPSYVCCVLQPPRDNIQFVIVMTQTYVLYLYVCVRVCVLPEVSPQADAALLTHVLYNKLDNAYIPSHINTPSLPFMSSLSLHILCFF